MRIYIYGVTWMILWCSFDMHLAEQYQGWWKEQERALVKKEEKALDVYKKKIKISSELWASWQIARQQAAQFILDFHRGTVRDTTKKNYTIIHSKTVPAFIMDILKRWLEQNSLDIQTISVKTGTFHYNEDFYIQPTEIKIDEKTLIPEKIIKPLIIFFNKELCALVDHHKYIIERHVIIPCVYKILACHTTQRASLIQLLRNNNLFKEDAALKMWEHQQDLSARLAIACHEPLYRKQLLLDYETRFMQQKCGDLECKNSNCFFLRRYVPLAPFYKKELEAMDRHMLSSRHSNPDLQRMKIISMPRQKTVRLYADSFFNAATRISRQKNLIDDLSDDEQDDDD